MGREDFNKGMDAGARPFEEKFRQEAKRNREWKESFEEKFDNVNAVNEGILNEMDSMQKVKFYRMHTLADIAELEKGDKETLLSLLFTLSEMAEETTEYQKAFLRSVKKCMENADEEERPKSWSILKDDDWSIIETIEGIDATKAVVQTVMAFLFLGCQNHGTNMCTYQGMFDEFSLNKKGFAEIMNQIDMVYRTLGLEGLAEMYGYVQEEQKQAQNDDSKQDDYQKKEYGSYGKLEEIRIAEEITIPEGEEKVFENQKIVFACKMKVKGNARLIFRNCEICVDKRTVCSYENEYIFQKYSYDHDSLVVIDTEGNSAVIFEQCTFNQIGFEWEKKWDSLGKRIYFINLSSEAKITVQDCYFDKVGYFSRSGGSVHIRHSYIKWNIEDIKDPYNFIWCDNAEMYDSVICEKEWSGEMNFPQLKTGGRLHIERCEFRGCSSLIFEINTEIYDSEFKNCTIGIYKEIGGNRYKGWKDGLFKNCNFEQCGFENNSDVYMAFENSKLLSCSGWIPTRYMERTISEGCDFYIKTTEKLELRECQFFNGFCKERGEKIMIVGGDGSIISDCSFKNLELGEKALISADASEGPEISIRLENCHFENIQTSNKILDNQYKYWKGTFKSKSVSGRINMNIRNCTGL